MTTEKTKPSTIYCIPKNTDKNFLNADVITQLRKEIFDDKRIIKNARLIVGCEIIDFENRFTGILDLAYKSFLLGMYYSTVSLTSLAAERLCYDLIENSEIRFGGRVLGSKQKEALYHIPYSDILDFLCDMKVIDKTTKDNLFKINNLRRRYIHPTFEGDPMNDAIFTLNKLCKTIDLILKSKKNES